MFSKTLLVSFLNICSIGISFATNVLIGRIFATGIEYDSFVASSILPNYLISVIAGSLSFTFLPVVSEIKNYSKEKKRNLLNTTCISAIIITLIIVFALIFFDNFIISKIVTGFETEQLKLTISLFRIYLPLIIFTTFNELLSGVFYSEEKFLIPLSVKLISPIFTILSVLFLFPLLGVYSLSLALLIGGITQSALLILFSLKTLKHRFALEINFRSDQFKKLLRVLTPLILSALFYRIFPVIDTYTLSKFSIGAISINSYAVKLNGAIVACFSAIFSIQLFAQLSLLNANSNLNIFKNNLSYYLRVIFNFTIPIALLVYLNSEEIIKLIYQGGNFTEKTAKEVSIILEIYTLFLPIIVVGGTISQALYSLMLTKKVMIVGLFEAIFYALSMILFLKYLGEKAVPIIYGVNFLVSTFALALLLRNKIALGGGKRILKSVLRISALSIFVILPLNLALKLLIHQNLFLLSTLFSTCIGIYVLISYFLNFEETKLIIDKLILSIKSK